MATVRGEAPAGGRDDAFDHAQAMSSIAVPNATSTEAGPDRERGHRPSVAGVESAPAMRKPAAPATVNSDTRTGRAARSAGEIPTLAVAAPTRRAPRP